MNQNIKITKKTMILLKEEQLKRLKKGEQVTLKQLIEKAVCSQY